MIQIPFVVHLKYDSFKQNIKTDTFIDQIIKVLSFNSDNNHHPSSTIHVCRYLTEDYEDEFKAAAGYSGLKFSSQISAVETVIIVSDVNLNISQLRILLRILGNKLGTNIFEPKKR